MTTTRSSIAFNPWRRAGATVTSMAKTGAKYGTGKPTP
jgi:hypothetical protein